MKVAPKLIFLIRDAEGFGSAMTSALHSNPKSSLRRLDEPFELSLERYGIREQKACGELVHFVDDKGNYQVSVLLVEKCEPPTLVCAINEVLAQITGETSTVPSLLAPFVVESSKLKGENKTSGASGSKVSLYGLQIGPDTDITQLMASRIQKPPSSLQIHYEPLACFLQLVRVLQLPTLILIAQSSTSASDKSSRGELEILYEIGDVLSTNTGLSFLRDKILWNPTKKSKDAQEPWRALYG